MTFLKMRYQRWLVWAISALFPMYQFMLQGFPSIMLADLTHDLSITLVKASFITTFFFFSYIVMQIPAGILVDVYGPRILLILGAFLAGITCMIFSCCHKLWVAEVSRLIMGFVCSPGIVAVFFLAAQWFKKKEFALMVGLTETLGMSGAAAGTLLLAAAVYSFGWRVAIFSAGAIGVLIAFLTLCFVRNKPNDPSFISDRAKTFSLKNEIKSLGIVMGRFQVWAAGIYMGLVFSVIPAFFALWGNPFFMKNYDLNQPQAAAINAVGLVGAGIGGPFLGWLSDQIHRRKIIMVFASIGSLIIFWLILRFHIPLKLAFVLNFLLGFVCSGYVVGFAIIKEILPKEVKGKAMGFANMLCLLLGAPILQPIIAILVKNPRHPDSVFRFALSPLLIAFVLSLLLTFFIQETHCKDLSGSQDGS